MTLSRADVEEFVAGVRDLGAGVDSRRAVQLRVVEPLLEVLGWDVRSPDVEPDVELAGTRTDYVLVVDETPVVAVRTGEPGDDLESEQTSLARTLEATTVDWGLCTDGRRYVLLAYSDDEVHRRRVELDDLPSRRDALEAYTRDVRAAKAAAASEERRTAYRQLAERRDAAVRAVTDALVDVAGDPIRDDARESAERLVAFLLDSGPSDAATADAAVSRDDAATDAHGPDRKSGIAGATRSDSAGVDPAADTDATPDSTSSTDSTARPTADRSSVPDDGEYVARFFGGSSSVGAVGTGDPGSTLAGVVTYLQENHDLGGAVTLPWGVEDGRAVLASAPEHPNGSPMEPREAVDGDCYVWTGASVDRTRDAVEELADAVGLRVMFQGDW